VTPIDALSVINFLNAPPALRGAQPSSLASPRHPNNRMLTDAAAAVAACDAKTDRCSETEGRRG